MRQLTSFLGLALAAAFALQPAQLEAQQPAQQQEVCTVTLAPMELQSGSEATAVTITVSQSIGEVTAVEGGESGIALAVASALPRTPLALPDDAPTPIRMGDSENQWIVYLNTAEAQEGTHELTFRSEQGTCTGEINVTSAGAPQ